MKNDSSLHSQLSTFNSQLPKGYKQTEVGVIPEGWEVTRIESIATVEGGYAFSSKKFLPRGKYQIVKMSNLHGGSLNLDRSASYLNELDEQEKHYLLHRDEILITLTGTTGKRDYGYLYKINNEQNLLLNQRVGRLIVGEPASPSYVAFQIKTPCFLDQFFDLSKGGTGNQTNVGTQDVAAIHIPLPPIPEQRAIAGALCDVDALIGALDSVLSKKRDLKQAAMQQLLTGQKRLPGLHGEWESVQFSDIADKSIPWSIGGGPFGSNLKASDYTDEGVRIIQLQNIGDGRFHDDYAIYTSEAKADELLSNNIYPGEIILSKMGDPVARACFVPTVDRRYLMASDGIRLAVDSRRFSKRFVHDYINSVYFRKKAIDASTGSTRQRIGLVELRQLPFVAPPLDEQTAIAEVLSDMDAELAALEQRRDKTRALKQGMMQELLTGRTRLV